MKKWQKLLEESYRIGYLYNPILLLGAVFAAISQFYGSAYIVFKKTNGAFTTTIIAAVVNVLIGIGLVNYIGLFAPALGTTIAFLVQWIVRMNQLKDSFRVTIDKKLLSVLCIGAGFMTVLYYFNGLWIHALCFAIGLFFFVIINRELLKKCIRKVLAK